MEIILASIISPLPIGLSLFLVLTPIRNLIRTHKIKYSIFWGLLVFCLSIVLLELLLANDIYSYSVGDESRLSKSEIASIESNKVPIFIEFALRGFLGKSAYDDTCHSLQSNICSLADKMMNKEPSQLWTADSALSVSIISFIIALNAAFSLLLFLYVGTLTHK